MSLTSHLNDPRSPVRAFLESQFPNVHAIAQEYKPGLAEVEVIRPRAPFPPHVYRLLGIAFDYRARYYFEDYSSCDTVAFQGGIGLFMHSACRSSGGLNGPESVWPLLEQLFGTAILGVGDLSQTGALDSTVARLRPMKRRLERDDEQLLARYCIALAYFEQVFRGGLQIKTPILRPKPLKSVEDILRIPEGGWVEDLCSLSWAFHDNFEHLFLTRRKARLNPTFDGSKDIGGADADLILGGCLVDFKAVLHPDLERYLYQLLGYTLLDYGDKHKIRELAVYLARHATMLKWPLEELVSRVSDGKPVPLEDLRGQFRIVLHTLDDHDELAADS